MYQGGLTKCRAVTVATQKLILLACPSLPSQWVSGGLNLGRVMQKNIQNWKLVTIGQNRMSLFSPICDNRVFLYVTYKEFATHFELKLCVCVYVMLCYVCVYFRRYWCLVIASLTENFGTSMSNVSGFCWFLLHLFLLAIHFSPYYFLKPIYTMIFKKKKLSLSNFS